MRACIWMVRMWMTIQSWAIERAARRLQSKCEEGAAQKLEDRFLDATVIWAAWFKILMSYPFETVSSWLCLFQLSRSAPFLTLSAWAVKHHTLCYCYGRNTVRAHKKLSKELAVFTVVFWSCSERGSLPKSSCATKGQLLFNSNRFGEPDPYFISQNDTSYT